MFVNNINASLFGFKGMILFLAANNDDRSRGRRIRFYWQLKIKQNT